MKQTVSTPFSFSSSLSLSVMTGWETENKYRIMNTLGQQVYFAAERKLTLYEMIAS